MPLAWAQCPMGDDRCHRNQGTDKMEGMCRDHSQARSRVVWWEQRGPDAGRGRTKMSGPDSWGCFGAGGLTRVCPKERSLGGEGTRMFLNVTWGLPHSGGDSEDNQDGRAEVSPGEISALAPEAWPGEVVSSLSLAIFQQAGIPQRGLSSG